MQINRSPAVYDVIVKNNSEDEEKSLPGLESSQFSSLKVLNYLCKDM